MESLIYLVFLSVQVLQYNHTQDKLRRILMISGVVNSFASVTIIRILSRVLEFFLRVYLIRSVLTPEIVAEMVGLDLILTTSLHIVKSCFKPSYQQVSSSESSKDKQNNIISSMNLMTFGIPVTLLSAMCILAFQWNHKVDTKLVHQTFCLYAVASILQAIRQKYSVQFVLDYQYRKLAIIELVSYLPKTLLLFIAARMGMFQQYGILVFGVGQFMYYLAALVITWAISKHKMVGIRALSITNQNKQIQNAVYVDPKTKKVLKQLSFLSGFKLFLQQFQKFVLVFNSTVLTSSIYSLISNLGSIIARFVFAPLEQITYNYYSRGSEKQSSQTLMSIIKMLVTFGLLCIGFGCRYAQSVLSMLYGQKWVNNDAIFGFQCYMVLIAVMGINGSIQSFVIARADVKHTVPMIKYFTVLSTIMYFGTSILFLYYGYGAAGLFLGNMIGMLCKIIINWNIEIKKHITLKEFIRGASPNPLFYIILIVTLMTSYQIQSRAQLSPFIDFIVGGVLFGITLLPILYQYRLQVKKLLHEKILSKKL